MATPETVTRYREIANNANNQIYKAIDEGKIFGAMWRFLQAYPPEVIYRVTSGISNLKENKKDLTMGIGIVVLGPIIIPTGMFAAASLSLINRVSHDKQN
jgi:hypothetical protein